MLQRAIDPLSRPFDDEFESLTRQYSGERPVHVDFRGMVGNSSAAERFTHRFHPYPAKLLLNIPLFFLNCGQLLRPGGVVYDPFCGSGTVLVEALVRGARARGSDANPLARLITRAKTTFISGEAVIDALKAILSHLPRPSNFLPAGPVDLTRWFSPEVRPHLGALLLAIRAHTAGELRVFFEVCFSVVLSRVSLTDPTVPVPVKINPKKKSLSYLQRKLRRAWIRERSQALVRFLAALAEHEIADRGRRRIERHLAEARLPVGKTLASFDFAAVPMVSKAQVMAIAAGDSWLEKGANLLLFGPPGLVT